MQQPIFLILPSPAAWENGPPVLPLSAMPLKFLLHILIVGGGLWPLSLQGPSVGTSGGIQDMLGFPLRKIPPGPGSLIWFCLESALSCPTVQQ